MRPVSDPQSFASPRLAAPLVLAALLSACAPGHDWREARSADGVVAVLFPCKPQRHERRVAIDGQDVKLALMACEAGGQTWGLASADVSDPTRLGAALDALAGAAAANASAKPQRLALQVPGAMVHPGSRRLLLQGHRPDGQPLVLQTALFAHGTRVYQATALGERVPQEAAEAFFGSLKVGP